MARVGGGGGQRCPRIVWRHLWMTTNSHLVHPMKCSLSYCFSSVSAGDPTGDIPEASPFSDISVTEMLQVKNYLNNQATLNLVQNNLAKTTDSIIILIEALRPPKAETLRYLDGSGPLPQRAARVILQR